VQSWLPESQHVDDNCHVQRPNTQIVVHRCSCGGGPNRQLYPEARTLTTSQTTNANSVRAFVFRLGSCSSDRSSPMRLTYNSTIRHHHLRKARDSESQHLDRPFCHRADNPDAFDCFSTVVLSQVPHTHAQPLRKTNVGA